ncbi:hypothetical protein DID88_001433 [Monilinia fructigena]|uniref:PNPLA domain-containing protein n=1 Tax=Monilinia fructigena TaxID=38457 RepID=A0A395IX10_9HELO|nr:hypothetical protein DID88_001433 [Monilinia fructigena]
MDENLLKPWGLSVTTPQGQSISDANSRGSSRSISLMATSTTTQNATPLATSTKEANGSISHSPSSSTGRGRSTISTNSPWDKKYILTLDGGGMRGMSTLLIIQNLMALCNTFEQSQDPLVESSFHPLPFQEGQGPTVNKNSRSAKFLPVHYFDYIAGTSTGGLIAIMLSRLRMNIDDCIQEYENLGKEVFGYPRHFSIRGPIPFNREKYDHRKLEKVIKDVVERRHLKVDQVAEPMYPSSQDRCRTIVLAIRENSSSDAPYLFRTYEHKKSACNYLEELNPGPAQPIPIWKVARATTAAPTYFKPIQLERERFIDGGFGGFSNNPTSRTFAEIEQMHGKGAVTLTLSIGTGRPTKVQPIAKHKSGFVRYILQLIKYTTATTTDSENTHERVRELLAAQGCPYERFNVDGGLGDINLGEWRIRGKENITLKKIRDQTRAYLEQSDVQTQMERMAKMLVNNRIERAKTSRWNVVATGHRYHCPKRCDDERIFMRDTDLRDHLCEAHGFSSFPRDSDEELKLEEAVKSGRISYTD